MALTTTVLSLVAVSLLFLSGSRLLYEQYYGEQNCEMTYMYLYPQYQKVPLERAIEEAFPQYSLHYYSESHYTHDESLESQKLRLSGVPALFIPGNGGSHKQSRSSASIAMRMHQAEFTSKKHFDFFTVNLNKELSGMFGGVLERQTEFVAVCIKHILSLYSGSKVKPKSVAIVAHSMGGLAAQALFGVEGFNSSWVTTIVSLASPLRRPVVSFDHVLQRFYDNINKVWSDSSVTSHVTLVSVAGGGRDVMIPTHLTSIPRAINIAAPAVTRNWVSADHRAVVWCRRVQLALTRALLLLQDASRRELTRDVERRERVFRYYLSTGKEIPTKIKMNVSLSLSKMKYLQSSASKIINYFQEGYNSSYTNVAIPLNHGDIERNHTYLLASNTGRMSWAYVCVVAEKAECTDVSSLAMLLPPKLGVVKYIQLGSTAISRLMGGATHLILSQPKDLPPKAAATKGFLLSEECIDEGRFTLRLGWWGGHVVLEPGHCTLMNFSLPHLTEIWQSYSCVISSSCSGVLRGGVVTPWHPHTPLTHSPPTQHNITVELSLQAPPPDGQHPHLLVWAPHTCSVEITVSPDPLSLVDKLVQIYAPLLLPWVTAVAMATSTRQNIGLELVVMAMLYAVTRNDGWTLGIDSDWQLLSRERMWCGWIPVVIHLIASGLQNAMAMVMSLIGAMLKYLCQGSRKVGVVSWMLAAVSVPFLYVCSGISLLFVIVALVLKMVAQRQLQGTRSPLWCKVVCVLLCLQLLTVPSILSWVKGIRFSVVLQGDPHLHTILPTLVVAMAMMYLDAFSGADKDERLNRIQLHTGQLLGLILVLFGLTHAYRAAYTVLAYLTIICLSHFLP